MLRHLFISLLALVGATLGGAVAGPSTAQAQGSDIDLAVSIGGLDGGDNDTANPDVTLFNLGLDAAYDVQVVIEADGISLDPTSDSPPQKINIPPIGSVALRDSKLIWRIDRLPGRSVYEYTVRTETLVEKVVQYVATVSSRIALEPEDSRHNNRAEAWQARGNTTGEYREAKPGYAVSVAVDNLFPQPGGTVTFSIGGAIPAEITDRDRASLRDVQVALALPAGLTFSTPTHPTNTSYDPETEIWTIGNWKWGTGIQPPLTATPLTLTATRTAKTVLNKQCVTAEISAKPPEPIGQTADNRRTVCLGESDEPVLFQSGEVDTFTTYPCVGITTYPCDTTDNIRVRAVDKTSTPERVLSPDTVLIHVQDAPGRTFDGQMHNNVLQSVNDATTVSWQTATDEQHGTPSFNGTQSGVKIAFSREEFDSTELANWTRHSGERIVVEGADGGSPPGSMYIRNSGSGRALSRMNSTNSWTASYNGSTSSAPTSAPNPWFAEFEKLGTYVVDYTTRAIHKTNTSPDCDFDNNNTNESFCDTETYTFHVGPIAELAVQDAAPNPAVPSSQRAFTIMAVNNGPDAAPAAKVTVNLQGATVSQATTSQGNYSNGVWTLGNLSVNGPTIAPTLTLITTAPADTPITTTITNTQDYEVCISTTGTSKGDDLSHTTKATCEADTTNGGSWHTAKYYDYKSANNTATITAQAGTRPPTAAITVEWTAPADVTVSRYQVWRQGSPWKLIAEVEAGETRYTDTTAEPGRAYLYMVRALDAQGIPVSSQTLVAAAPQTGGQGGQGGSGGSTRPPPTDHHGNSPATATPLALPPLAWAAFLHAGDQDYFRLVLPHTGLLYVETTGWSNTVGTVWQGGVELGSAELGGRLYNFKLGVPVQPGPVVIRVTERSRTAFGTYRLYTRFIAGSGGPAAAQYRPERPGYGHRLAV